MIIILLILLSLSSCTDKKDILTLDGVEETTVYLNEITFNEPSFFPKGCIATDSFLIVFSPKDKEGFIYIYDKEKKNLLAKYGRIGEGPNDFKNPRFLPNKTLLSSDNVLLVDDVTDLYEISIDSILNTKDYTPVSILKIPDNLMLYNSIIHNSDSMLVLNQTGEHQLTFYDRQTKKVERKNYFKKLKYSSNISDLSYVMQVYDACYSSNNENFVIAYKNWKQIDIISTTGDLLKQIYFADYDFNKNKMSFNEGFRLNENAKLFFTFIYPTKKSFYALCWENTKNNIKQGIARTDIYKFNWDGELKEIFHLNKSISYFCIDKSNRLYAIGISEDNLDLNIFSAILM